MQPRTVRDLTEFQHVQAHRPVPRHQPRRAGAARASSCRCCRRFGIRLSSNGGLLVMAALFGFGGSFISLLMSKWIAKRSTGAQVIEQPRNEAEQWLVATVRRQAEAGRHRHARSGDLRRAGDQRLRHRRQPQQRAGRGVHRPAAGDEPRRGRGRARPRGQPRRQRRHGDDGADPGRAQHLRDRAGARGRPRRSTATSAATARAARASATT